MNEKLSNRLNGKSIYIWRVLIIILFGILGFFGTRLYAQIDRNQDAIYAIATSTATKNDLQSVILPMERDIRELRSEMRNLNSYLRK